MAEIKHRLGIACKAEIIYQALTTDKGLSGWWTRTVEGAGEAGSIINFWFNDTCVQFRVLKLQESKWVCWEHTGDTPEGWKGTIVNFRLEPVEGQVFVNFSHSGWKESGDFLAHCSTKWAVFLMSLKDMLETGKGQPYPDDRHIDHGEY